MKLTELKESYDRYLELNYISEDTKKNYRNCFKKFISENSRIYRMSNEDLKNYFIQFKSKYSISYYNQMLSSLMIIFKILNQPQKLKGIGFLKDRPKMVNILSIEEIRSSLKNIHNIKHRCIITLLYIGALRRSELQNIRIEDVDSDNNRILVNNGKGGDSRYFPISNKDIIDLREYYKKYRPKTYLFEGIIKGKKYSSTSISRVVGKIQSKKRVYPHLLRHTALTNQVDNNHNHLKIMVLSGHKNPKSLQRYYHLSESALQDMTLTLKQ